MSRMCPDGIRKKDIDDEALEDLAPHILESRRRSFTMELEDYIDSDSIRKIVQPHLWKADKKREKEDNR